MVRRHARTAEDEHHYGPSVGVVSGNFVTGRRRGIVDGVDFGATGSGQRLCMQAYMRGLCAEYTAAHKSVIILVSEERLALH